MTFSPPSVRTIGILGAGRVGTALARQALKSGFEVRIATAKPAGEIELLVEVMAPGAKATSAREVAESDLVVLAIPLHKYATLDPTMLAGKVVIDAMNYWPIVDGALSVFDSSHLGTSEVIADFLSEARLVKTLNHIGYHDLEEHGKPSGSGDRRGLAIAGDDEDAKRLVAQFIDGLGYDPVDVGGLATGRAFQPGTEIFNGVHTAQQLRELATREFELHCA